MSRKCNQKKIVGGDAKVGESGSSMYDIRIAMVKREYKKVV